MKFKIGDRVKNTKLGFTGKIVEIEHFISVLIDGTHQIDKCNEDSLELELEDVDKQKWEERFAELRKASGDIKSNDQLVSFLYELMRDYVPCGTVERIAQGCSYKEYSFTNGFLASYAKNIAKKLR